MILMYTLYYFLFKLRCFIFKTFCFEINFREFCNLHVQQSLQIPTIHFAVSNLGQQFYFDETGHECAFSLAGGFCANYFIRTRVASVGHTCFPAYPETTLGMGVFIWYTGEFVACLSVLFGRAENRQLISGHAQCIDTLVHHCNRCIIFLN